MLDLIRAVPKNRTVKYQKNRGVLFHNLGFVNRLLFYIATFGFGLAFVFFIYWFYPMALVYFSYTINRPELANIDKVISTEQPKAQTYAINIPKISAIADIQANVSPFDPADYIPVLNNDKVAQSKTSSPPGEGKGTTTYIFAHSSNEGLAARKNPVFYLLGELNKGDSVWIDYQGKKYFYKVYDKKIISANDISYLTYSDKNRDVLILQTCWPIGTDWRRLLVFAELLAY